MKRALFLALLLLSACSKSVNITDNNAPGEDGGGPIVPGEEDAGPEAPKTTVFVDPVNGNDANDGRSLAKSLKSLKKALKVVVAGETIDLASGKYGAGNGDDFKNEDPKAAPTFGYVVPDKITIKTAQPGGAILEGAGDSNLLFIRDDSKGPIKIVNLAFTNAWTALFINGGVVELAGTSFEKVSQGIAATGGTLSVTCASCTFKGQMGMAIQAQNAAEVKLTNGTFKDLVSIVANNVATVVQASQSANVDFANTTIESSEACLGDVRDDAKLTLFQSSVKNNKKGQYCSYFMLNGNGTKSPLLKIIQGQIVNNAGGAIYINNGGIADLNGPEISDNGEYGIQVSGLGSVKARSTKVKNHTVANIRLQASVGAGSKLLEPSVDFGNASEGGANFVGFDNTTVPAGRFGLEMLYGAGPEPTAKTSTFIGTQWTFNNPQPSGTVTSSYPGKEMAPHYTIQGDGAKVVFSN